MEDSVVYQLIVEKGVKKGRTEGRKEGRTEGELLNARKMVIAMGTQKFGAPPKKVLGEINKEQSAARLQELSLRLLTAHDWNEVLHDAKAPRRKKK